MMYHCRKCSGSLEQVKDAIGMPLSTAFPPDLPSVAGTIPYAPFVCYNHGAYGLVEYMPVVLEVE